ncbi:asparaginyl-tRNA synthetase [Capronia epimyces CBS 606.96]|uniref:asparagine--tRNA ligase n=1 Tax=Capronia epimyces CBS 606.96 TaxID=1182542 RepID=W9YB24_9EURO|nr:asparaginyl-tRNA synthetase [Capronia epimyces CBS 606.96]EXJ89728.1 asparaginyl-tRNA synthetase [Capronia epimyces CBS 606.96]
MLWRTLPSPWRPGSFVQSPFPQLSNRFTRPRHIPSPYRIRPLHDDRSIRLVPSSTIPSIRHAKLLEDPTQYEANHIKITGLVRSVRKQKKVAFARIADGSTLASVQAVFPEPALAKDITNGAYVALIGSWIPSAGAGQTHELQVDRIETIGESNPLENPIQKQSMSVDFLRTIPHLRMRTSFQSLVARTRSHLTAAVGSYFHNATNPVYQVHPPLITSSDCEGAGEVFTITPQSSERVPDCTPNASKDEERLYFRDPKYLTVSSQLHLEAYAAELGDVFAFSPTFRAEESDTPRHLSEFYMLEAEHRAISLDDLLAKVRALVVHLVQSVREHQTGRELVKYYTDQRHQAQDAEPIDLEDRWNRLAGPWHTVDYSSATKALREAHDSNGGKLFATPPHWDHGLQLEHERWIVENIAKGNPVFVTHYPRAIKPFYMLPSSPSKSNDQPEHVEPSSSIDGRQTVACFDLLLPFGYCEVVGGSLREHRLENLIKNMREKGLLKIAETPNGDAYPFLQPGESLGNLKWYADLRRFGSSPHGGYGLGFDRLLAYLTGAGNVREVVGFPRTWGRADC